MRIKDMRFLATSALERLRAVKADLIQNPGAQVFVRVQGAEGAVAAAADLMTIDAPTLSAKAKAVRDDPRLAGPGYLDLKQANWDGVDASLRELTTHVELLLQVLNMSQPAPKHEAIDIRLPDSPTLSELAAYIERLKKIHDLVAPRGEGAEPSIVSFDSGSIWITLLLGSVATYRMLGLLQWSALAIAAFKQKHARFIQEARLLGHVDAVIEKSNDLADAQLRLLLREEAQRDLEGSGLPTDPESIERARVALEETMSLIERGVQIMASLPRADEPPNLFPDVSKGVAALAARYQPVLASSSTIATAAAAGGEATSDKPSK